MSDELETTRLEWAKGPYQLSAGECRVVMDRLAHLEAENERIVRYWIEHVSDLEQQLTVMRNQLRNAVGAVIDTGNHYCEGPHDVAAAIYRLTAERDALKETP